MKTKTQKQQERKESDGTVFSTNISYYGDTITISSTDLVTLQLFLSHCALSLRHEAALNQSDGFYTSAECDNRAADSLRDGYFELQRLAILKKNLRKEIKL